MIQEDKSATLSTLNDQYLFQPIADSYILDDQGGSQISVRDDGKSPTLRAEMHGNIPCVIESAGFKAGNGSKAGGVGFEVERSPTLAAASSGTNQTPTVVVRQTEPRASYARGNGDGFTIATITGDHENRITDYTNVIVSPEVDTLTFDTTQITNPKNGCNPQWGDPCHPITAQGHVPTSIISYGIGNGQTNQGVSEEQCGALNCMHDQQAVCYGVDCRNGVETPELNGTLQAKANGGQSLNCNQIVRTDYVVRRLTPIECARLQGFPDDWGTPDHKDDFTDSEYKFWLDVRNAHAAINGKVVKDYTQDQMVKWYNKLHTDSSEYKMWGNGIALPTALYVMQGISEQLNSIEVT